MDWTWLTPPIAAVFAGTLTALAALIGSIYTGRRTVEANERAVEAQQVIAHKQLEAQHELAVAQLETQERIAAANRIAQHEQNLLSERRELYAQVIERGRRLALRADRQEE